MHDPSLRADVGHRGEVGLHESSEVGSSLLVREFAVGESKSCEYDCLAVKPTAGTRIPTGHRSVDGS